MPRLLSDTPNPGHISHEFKLGPAAGAPSADVVVHTGKVADEIDTPQALTPRQILVYTGELDDIDNPRGNDRDELQKQAIR